MKRLLGGIIPPMVTPLRDRDELDVPGLERLIERILAGGVSGVFLLGTTGEGPGLSYRLRRELVQRTCALLKGRIPVLVGITDTSFVESVSLARRAADAGADAVVVAPPYYLPASQPELQEYLDHLIAELPLPLVLYNMPALTKVSFELKTVRRALDEPRIIGLKDSSGDMTYFRQAIELAAGRPDWSWLIGPEELLADALAAGAHGGVCGGANLFPELYVQLVEAFRVGNETQVRELRAQIIRVRESLYGIGRHPSAIIKGIKCALACLGVCNDFMGEPFHRFRDQERAEVKERLRELIPTLEGVAKASGENAEIRVIND
jgi:dihydrodipicolinate synthase/N-acetylneuraminate lyase